MLKFNFILILSIFSKTASSQIIHDYEICNEKFKNNLRMNLGIENMTIQELRSHISLADYYLFSTFDQQQNKFITKSEFYKDICNINYNNVNYDLIKEKIEISLDSKEKLNELLKLNNNIKNKLGIVKNIIVYLVSLYLFYKNPIFIFIYFIYMILF